MQEDVEKLISSGLLEMYVMGLTTEQENLLVEELAQNSATVQNELNEIGMALENYSAEFIVPPPKMTGPFLTAMIDYSERMKNGEKQTFPPVLTGNSRISDYACWLNRKDMQPQFHDEVCARIIGYTPLITTAIVWLKYGAPEEVHTHELEKFLIVEGSCEIVIDNYPLHLEAGDILTIPLHKSHCVNVTSNIPCKVILQRVAI